MSEPMRMNLVGLEPVLYEKIKALAERTIREFDGAPEGARDFQDAQRILAAMADIEADR